MALVKALMHPTEKGKHWGEITANARDVFEAQLWGVFPVSWGNGGNIS
jgi:hypothetical protein